MWNPELYLKFETYRARTAIDLVSSIESKNSGRILDIGCGPGNSTGILKDRWPKAEVIGLDLSETMLEKAIKSYPDITFYNRNMVEDLSDLGKFDIVFSNNAIQWIKNNHKLIPRYYNMLEKKGVLAVQVPNPTGIPLHTAVLKVSGDRRWKKRFSEYSDELHFFEPIDYYNALSELKGKIRVWETWYNRIMNNCDEIIEWYKPTGMKPFLSRLDDEEQKLFVKKVKNIISDQYQKNNDNTVLFPFRSIFFTIAEER